MAEEINSQNRQMENLKFEYKLNYEECYETFYFLCVKWRKKVRTVLAALLTIIGIMMLAGYALDSEKIHCFFIALLDIFLLYYLIYEPVLKAKKGAKKVWLKDGIYRVEISSDGEIRTGNERIPIKGDKDARVIETSDIFVIRPDRLHTFCLPKRMMTKEEIVFLQNVLKK